MAYRYPEAMILDAIEYAGEGMRAAQIADQLAIDGWERVPTSRAVQHWINKGTPRPYRHASPYGPGEKQRAIDLYLSGLALREVSARMGPDGPTTSTIRSWVLDAGHKARRYTCSPKQKARWAS